MESSSTLRSMGQRNLKHLTQTDDEQKLTIFMKAPAFESRIKQEPKSSKETPIIWPKIQPKNSNHLM